MDVRAYEAIAKRTDQLQPKSPTHRNFKIMPIVGLAGEIGSLLAELKKRVREPNRAVDQGTDRIKEELGDIIWYSVTIARRARLNFRRDVLLANLDRTRKTPKLYGPASREGTRPERSKLRLGSVSSFNNYQRAAVKTAELENDNSVVIPYLARIWKNSGELLDHIDPEVATFSKDERRSLAHSLGDVMWYVASFATLYDLRLDEVVEANADKAQSMFMPPGQRTPTRLHDVGDKALEQFPRKFRVDFVPVDSETSVMLINGMQLGDPLRDNAFQVGEDIDGYRFHDCVHLAFVAVLGWSPVVRALMQRKRKSDKKKDDAEDGARARIVEEMVVKLTHSYAVGIDPKKLLKGRTRVDMDLLKQIGTLAAGLEVTKNKLWEWEKAILLGYELFDLLRAERQGRLTLDLTKRTVKFSKISKVVAERFPTVA